MWWSVGVLGPWSGLRQRFVLAIPQVLQLPWHMTCEGRCGMTKKRHLAFLLHFSHKQVLPLWANTGSYKQFCTPFSSEPKLLSGLSKVGLSLQVIIDTGITKDLLLANNHLVNLFHPSSIIFLLLDAMPLYTTYSPCSLWHPWKTFTYGHFLLALEKRSSPRSQQKTYWSSKSSTKT